MKVYMAVTADKFELPIAVFDSISNLMLWSKRTKASLHSAILRHNKDSRLGCLYVKVEVDDEDCL